MLSWYFDLPGYIHGTDGLSPEGKKDILGVSSTDNPLGTFYDIHARKEEVLFFCSVPDTTRDVVAFPSVANTHYSKISSSVMLSWYFDLPEGVTMPLTLYPRRGRDILIVNPLVAYDMHGRKRELLLSISHTTARQIIV
jgi:hypothetical protein